MTKRRKRKTPRLALVELREIHDLAEIGSGFQDALSSMQALLSVLRPLADTCAQLIHVVSQMHAAQEKRSNAARKANATRKGQGSATDDLPSDDPPAP